MVYLDDILIFGTCLKEHRQLVKEVLKRLQGNDLYADGGFKVKVVCVCR